MPYGKTMGTTPANATFAAVPVGAINGINTIYTLANAPNPAASLQLFLNRVLVEAGTDFTLAGLTITYTLAPQVGDIHYAYYFF